MRFFIVRLWLVCFTLAVSACGGNGGTSDADGEDDVGSDTGADGDISNDADSIEDVREVDDANDDDEGVDVGVDDGVDDAVEDVHTYECGNGIIEPPEECEGGDRLCTTSCGSPSRQYCSTTCMWGACSPPLEVCNGVDDNCDGETDEGFGCTAGELAPCTTTCGSTGEGRCTFGGCSEAPSWACRPPEEMCNGIDDDCDGETDEDACHCSGDDTWCGTACVDLTTDASNCGSCGRGCASGQSCVLGVCTCAASEDCDDGDDTTIDDCTAGSCVHSLDCTPSVEDCNGIDDDCDGETDEGGGFASCPAWGEGCCDGICTSLLADSYNCGICGNRCWIEGGGYCDNGDCRSPL